MDLRDGVRLALFAQRLAQEHKCTAFSVDLGNLRVPAQTDADMQHNIMLTLDALKVRRHGQCHGVLEGGKLSIFLLAAR